VVAVRPVVSIAIDTECSPARVAVVTLDSPPVNMGNARVRGELLGAFRGLRDVEGLAAVVLRSALDDFYAGSDIREFDGEIALPQLPAVIDALDDLGVPVVAALTGSTLGGGLELALGADVRIAAEGTVLGLPEVSLGILPGAGGTVRLPRLVGVPEALRLVGGARRIGAQEALRIGLVDAVVAPAELLAAALAAGRSARRRRLVDLRAPAADLDAVTAAVAEVTRRARPNVVRAVELVRTGVDLSGRAALAVERAAFEELRPSAEAADLRYAFFAERAAAKALRVDAPAAAIRSVGIAGAGTMGSAIARLCLTRGLPVTLFDANAVVLARAAGALAEVGGELTTSGEVGALADVDLVIDAVFEDMAVKKGLFTTLQDVVRPDAVLASNSSYLDLDEISRVLRAPGRFAGLHFFNPADRNRLVEVVSTAAAGEETRGTLAAFARRLSKTAISARVGEGFVANRVYADYRAQAEFLLEDGASPRQVDDAMTRFGLAIGPFAVADMSGLDIAWARRTRLAATRDPAQRYVHVPDRLCEAGRLGRKTGAGWYRYDEQHPRGGDDPVVADLLTAARAEKGIEPRTLSDGEIQQRVLVSMLVAAAHLVEDGTAAQAGDVDVALVAGFAFPRWRGGPLRFCARQSEAWLLEGLAAVAASDPVGFALAVPALDGEVPPAVRRVLAEVAPVRE
jgi:3-hydroxyacyl-CoA dehydrogenase